MRYSVTNLEVALEVAGWTAIDTYSDSAGPDFLIGTPPPTIGADANNEWCVRQPPPTKLPDWLHDMNLILELELALTEDEFRVYRDEIILLLHGLTMSDTSFDQFKRLIFTAPKDLRCQALVNMKRTMKKKV